jgi:hypothetical protein
MLPARRRALEKAGAAVVAPPITRATSSTSGGGEVEGQEGEVADGDMWAGGSGSEGEQVDGVEDEGLAHPGEPLSEREYNKDAWKALGQ